MSTILFHEIVFGPVHSRRLGISLGINLLPYDGKLCSFDCLYCECGFNDDFKTKTKIPSRENVKEALENKLIQLHSENVTPDVFTFAGNGEPTLHPEFLEIIEDTIQLRDAYFAAAKISVLSNGIHINKEKIVKALKLVDNNILKLDSAINETAYFLDRPNSKQYNVDKQLELFKQFEGNFIMQTMFVRGTHNGKEIDNTTENEISAWLEAIQSTNPREVMIYTIERETPEKSLQKVSIEELRNIGERVEAINIKINIAG